MSYTNTVPKTVTEVTEPSVIVPTNKDAPPHALDPNGLRPFHRPVINLYPSTVDTGYIRSWPEVVEFNANVNPNHVFCLQAKKQPGTSSFSLLSVTNAQLRDAVAGCGRWLESTIPELQLPTIQGNGEVQKGSPVALLMESDIGLMLHQLALIGLGVPVLLLSARLSATAIHHLVQSTQASAIIASTRLATTAHEAVNLMPESDSTCRPVYTPNSYDTFLLTQEATSDQGSICHPHHYFSESDRDVLILHSSGTTGLPKPIYVSHRHMVSFFSCHGLVSEHEAQGINVSTLPLYHGFGLVAPALAMSVGKTLCLPATSVVPSARSTIDLVVAARAASLMSVPSILEDTTVMPEGEGVQVLAKLDFVTFGGGILKEVVGDRLTANGVKILNHYGTTESGPLAPIFVPRSSDYDWRFFRLRKDLRMKLAEIEPQDGERRFKLTTYPFGWGRPFEIQDQLVCNPEHPESDFTAVGRQDDWIVLSTGEKVLPQILESMLCDSDLVKAAVAFGEHRSEIGVLVQPAELLPASSYVSFREQIWPIVTLAGLKMDHHARVSSIDAILIVPADTAIPRTDKGSIARKEVYRRYEDEISGIYDVLDNLSDLSIPPLQFDKLEDSIKGLIQSHLRWDIGPEAWTVDDDLFELGLDSLQALRLRRLLLAAASFLKERPERLERIGKDFVYSYPTVQRMAQALRDSVLFGANTHLHFAADIDSIVQQYTLNADSRAVVFLTGATGSLGSHCLGRLVRSPNVQRVICQIRLRKRTESRVESTAFQRLSLQTKGIILTDEERAKIQLVESNAAERFLGLPEGQYRQLQDSITHILHVAWPMDFKRTLPSFSAQFQALQNLVQLAQDAHKARPHTKPRLIFISSVATVGQYANIRGGRTVPETPVPSADCVNAIGYAHAKLACERILERVAEHHGSELEVSYVRLGQIAGSSLTGFWNPHEHIAALVKSSQHVGALPQLPGVLSWIPVDQAADVLSEILLTDQHLNLVYHLENPIRQSWTDVLEIWRSELGIAQLIPFLQWLDLVEAPSNADHDRNPAAKLADFFRQDFERMACGRVVLGTDKSRATSPTLQAIDAVSSDVVRSYIRNWRSSGHLG